MLHIGCFEIFILQVQLCFLLASLLGTIPNKVIFVSIVEACIWHPFCYSLNLPQLISIGGSCDNTSLISLSEGDVTGPLLLVLYRLVFILLTMDSSKDLPVGR